MVPQPRAGSFSPNPAQTLQTGASHTPHSAQPGALSAGASPSTSSPTGTNSLTKIVVAQVYLLLSTIKEDKESSKWEVQAEQLRKLIDDNGMEVFSKYFTRLVAGNASVIFPSLGRAAPASGNYHILLTEMRKLTKSVEQASKIAESIEGGTEDIFRDFDLAGFMEHFDLDALEKATLALAFKTGTRADLKVKADAILSSNFSAFVDILSRPAPHPDSEPSPAFVAFILDRFVQYHPPTFNAASKAELADKVRQRYPEEKPPPSEVLAALDLVRVLGDKPVNALALYIQRTGADFTRDEDTCSAYLHARPKNIQLSEEQVSVALTYTTISQSPGYDPSILTNSLLAVLSPGFTWQNVVSYFDQRSSRISPSQFLRLYNALLLVARNPSSGLDIQSLWGGHWENAETQLSFICAYGTLKPDELDATTIPGLVSGLSLDFYAQASPSVQERATVAVRHPLSSVAALSAIFHLALHSNHASTTTEAKRLFQDVVVPNLDIFMVTAFEVPKPWGSIAHDTLNSLFETFLYKQSPHHEFVLYTLWGKHRDWILTRLADLHTGKVLETQRLVELTAELGWLEELIYMPTELGCEMALMAHFKNILDLGEWAKQSVERGQDVTDILGRFLLSRATEEIELQRPPEGKAPAKSQLRLQVRMVSILLQVLEDTLPKAPVPQLITIQRLCITAYPRLINYGEGYDDIIDSNGSDGNGLPPAANARMEEHYKRMYSDEIQVRDIVEILDRYKHSRDPLDQDIFACMIHGLFDEYAHYANYPVEALATTAVLFGGIIAHKLIPDLPLKIGLGMILEAVKDHPREHPMYKFGLQALMQLFVRFREWPGFCKQLLQIPSLHGTEAWNKAQEVVRLHEEEMARSSHGGGLEAPIAVAEADDLGSERKPPPFTAINVNPRPLGVEFEEPSAETQGRVQFVLNNLTDATLATMFQDLTGMLDVAHHPWFASHLVEERAKMQPNYHHVYLELVKQFASRELWVEVLRATYVTVRRMLNSEVIMQSSSERTHLKNLGSWLGLLTIARDKPIKHKHIAFRQLLMEALDTQRLLVVIPFVCKVLVQGAMSSVFRPPNPWLMDMIHLLIELYHHADLKLNLKFEIEVLCKGLNLDVRSIEPSQELQNRTASEITDTNGQDTTVQLEAGFEGMGLNSIGSTLAMSIPAPTIPDLTPHISVPPTNEMVISTARLGEIVRKGLDHAIREIIGPVVERSVTIAAIATTNIIRKDFAIEGDETRVRDCAIKMVKATAGSLALVTSKEPMRANLTNYIRNSSAELPQGLPEGTIMMCVNSNIDLACSVIEKSAEERAVPEIEEMIQPDLEARRLHRLSRPNEPYIDAGLSRWALTMPNPFKLSPSLSGLNPEQMAIYEDFARQPRSTSASNVAAHAPSVSDATRSMANEVLQEQFGAAPNIPTPTETPSIQQHLGLQMQQPYNSTMHSGSGPTNGARAAPGFHQDMRSLYERVQKLIQELQRVASEAREEHFLGLPRSHPVLDVVDALVQFIIKTSQTSDDFPGLAAEQICQVIFSQQVDDNLTLESLVHVLETLRRIGVRNLSSRVVTLFRQQPPHLFLSLPLLSALVRTDLVDWRNVDITLSNALQQKKDGSLEFLERLLDMTVLNDRPVLLYTDFSQTLKAAWAWIREDGGSDVICQRLKSKLLGPSTDQPQPPSELDTSAKQELMEYVFEEWVHLYQNSSATEQIEMAFVRQLQSSGIVASKDDLYLFLRAAIDISVESFDQASPPSPSIPEAFVSTDALAHFVGLLLRVDDTMATVPFVDSIMAFMGLVLNHHYVVRGEAFNQKVFHRLFSGMLHETSLFSERLLDSDRALLMTTLAKRLMQLGPMHLPGFSHGWLLLVQHRSFLLKVAGSNNRGSWSSYTQLLCQQLDFLGELLKSCDVPTAAKDVYRATLKLLVVLQHDFPDFVAANCLSLCASIPPHCTQLLGAVLSGSPASVSNKMRDPQGDASGEVDETVLSVQDAITTLEEHGILELADLILGTGPSEDAVAHLVRAFTMGEMETTFGHVPVKANSKIIGAFTVYTGIHALRRGNGANYQPSCPEAATLSFLVRELPVETRYYLLSWIINQLRFPGPLTTFFSHVLLDIFGRDLEDPDETEIRQQITRIILERLVGYWPQPWGLMLTVMELVKNDRYMFFELPFIKSTPEVAERFASMVRRG
jgi:CCR4-NOT transcription complex subunit 1